MYVEHLDPFIGASAAVALLRQEATHLQDDALPVLILGEPGSGKGALARWIHQHGPRRTEPFVEVPCLPGLAGQLDARIFGTEGFPWDPRHPSRAGLLEQLGAGTLFLDEIANLDLGLQHRLDWVIESREFQRAGGCEARRAGFRIIASSAQDMDALVRRGAFRWDLHASLCAHVLLVPPLRHRPEDIPVLVARMLEHLGNRTRRSGLTLSPEALDALLDYRWPRNIRELRGCIERAARSCEGNRIGPEHLQLDSARPHLGDGSKRWEKFRDSATASPIHLAPPRLACAARS